MMRNRKAVGNPRRGTVLLTVLWTIALMSALAMAAAVSFRGFAGIAAVGRDRVQGDALLTGGLEMAAGAVSSLGDTPLTEREITADLSTGAVRARFSDEGGRIDVGRAPAAVLASLLVLSVRRNRRRRVSPRGSSNGVVVTLPDQRTPAPLRATTSQRSQTRSSPLLTFARSHRFPVWRRHGSLRWRRSRPCSAPKP
jgi:hypothetical protein